MSQWQPIAEIAGLVQGGKTSAVELVERGLKAIEGKKEFSAILATTAGRATERAKVIDGIVARGENAGRLAGVPFIAKDNFLAYGAETTAASNILKGFEAPYQATAIKRLEAEGAVCIAKANLDAFAHGSSTENSDFMVTKNPHDKSRVPGGSSGGSAAAVMLDMAPFALGTDTGGSIRQPAAFCGAVGLKPSYGLVSRSGVVAMASSTDVVGPITRSVEDAALVLDCMAGRDEMDSTTIERETKGYSLENFDFQVNGSKVGVVREYMEEGLSDEVRTSVGASIDLLKKAGADVREVSLPSVPLALACYYILAPAEVSSNLGRYDGQRYGFSYPEASDLEESYSKSRSIGFGRETKRRIMIGTYVLSSGYYDAYYKLAQKLRTKLIQEFESVFQDFDFLVGPATPTTAFKLGENTKDPLRMYMSDILTVASNLSGTPAISIPSHKPEGLPVGLQFMASYGSDRRLLEMAKAAERIVA